MLVFLKRGVIFYLILIAFISCKDLNSFFAVSQTVSIDTTYNYYPSSTSGDIIFHEYFKLSYVEPHEQAEWVAYRLTRAHLKRTNYDRPYFIQDPNVKTKSADWRNFRNSGYDRGHLCPAGDMKISKKAYEDTFYTSNVSPQLPSFNNGVWNRLENKVRYWAQKYDGLFVITGGVLEEGLKTIGQENVSVPNYFYKILLDDSNGRLRTIAFLVPHEKSDRPLYEFVVSIREIESLTGIDFFENLPKDIQDQLETASSYKSWSF